MILILIGLLFQDPAADIDRLVRDLGHELIEVRERAHASLLAAGVKAVIPLRGTLQSNDAEVRLRAVTLLEVIERSDRERAHDEDQKAALLLLRRDVDAERRPGSGATEGARFDVTANPFDGGWIVTTRVRDYLERPSLEGPGRGQLRFDVQVSGTGGREFLLERCGRCSPTKVFVQIPEGPLNVRITGEQTWFSPYHLEFKDPIEGQSKRVGDFSITVAWPALQVTSQRQFPEEWIPSMAAAFQCTQKEGLGLNGWRTGRSIG